MSNEIFAKDAQVQSLWTRFVSWVKRIFGLGQSDVVEQVEDIREDAASVVSDVQSSVNNAVSAVSKSV